MFIIVIYNMIFWIVLQLFVFLFKKKKIIKPSLLIKYAYEHVRQLCIIYKPQKLLQ